MSFIINAFERRTWQIAIIYIFPKAQQLHKVCGAKVSINIISEAGRSSSYQFHLKQYHAILKMFHMDLQILRLSK